MLSLQGHREKSKSRTTGQKVVTQQCPAKQVFVRLRRARFLGGTVECYDFPACGTTFGLVSMSLQGQRKLVRLFRQWYDLGVRPGAQPAE